MTVITEVSNLEPIYRYQRRFQSPYFFPVDISDWEASFTRDVNGEGRTLFKELHTKAAYAGEKLVGFIQYGKTGVGFDSQGALSSEVSHNVIRNFYFDEDRKDAGRLLLKQALGAFETSEQVYAFFHYFGMSVFARHGKLFFCHTHIEEVLLEHGFEIEHENVYYSSILKKGEAEQVTMLTGTLSAGNEETVQFLLQGKQVGGCQVHFVDRKTAYLRWIYVEETMKGKGIGTRCMKALQQWLYEKGIRRFDTDTARSNVAARHFYEKNGFSREGITRSYYRQ